MLTINAFLYVVNSKLPRCAARQSPPCAARGVTRLRLVPSISYLAWIHYYTIMSFLCVFGIVIQVVVVHVIDPEASGIKRDPDLEVRVPRTGSVRVHEDKLTLKRRATARPHRGAGPDRL